MHFLWFLKVKKKKKKQLKNLILNCVKIYHIIQSFFNLKIFIQMEDFNYACESEHMSFLKDNTEIWTFKIWKWCVLFLKWSNLKCLLVYSFYLP